MNSKSTLTMFLSVLALLGLVLAVPADLALRESRLDLFKSCVNKFAPCHSGTPQFNKTACSSLAINHCYPAGRSLEDRDAALDKASLALKKCAHKFPACKLGGPHYDRKTCTSNLIFNCGFTERSAKDGDIAFEAREYDGLEARDIEELEERSADVSTSLEAKSVDVDIEARGDTIARPVPDGGAYITCTTACLNARSHCLAVTGNSNRCQVGYRLCVLGCTRLELRDNHPKVEARSIDVDIEARGNATAGPLPDGNAYIGCTTACLGARSHCLAVTGNSNRCQVAYRLCILGCTGLKTRDNGSGELSIDDEGSLDIKPRSIDDGTSLVLKPKSVDVGVEEREEEIELL